MKQDLTALEKAQAAWGAELPAWVEQLATASDATSQAKVAQLISYSTAAVSQVIRNIWPGDLNAVQTAVECAFNTNLILCPTMGEISSQACKTEKSKPFSSINSRHVQQYKACQRCSHNKQDKNL